MKALALWQMLGGKIRILQNRFLETEDDIQHKSDKCWQHRLK